MFRIPKCLSVLGLCAVVAACELGSNVEDFDVTMQQTDDVLTQAVGSWYASVTGGTSAAAAVDPDTVESLVVRVTEIQFLPAENEANEEDEGAWMSLGLDEPVLLNLVTLPTEGESPLVIASGAVDVGDYNNVRLFTDSAAIVFKGPIDLGAAFSYESGTVYQVTIPSGPETGLKTDVSFSVAEGEGGEPNAVNLLFSSTATFTNVTGTGTGAVILAPVIRGQGDGS